MPSTPAIEFSDTGTAAKINYSVPLPGAHTGRRVTEIDVGLNRAAFKDESRSKGLSLSELLELKPVPAGIATFNNAVARQLVASQLKPSRSALGSEGRMMTRALAMTTADQQPNNAIGPELVMTVLEHTAILPTLTWAGDITSVEVPLNPVPNPRFFIVEKYGISSFLGDYGMGRTVKTFTLLPGESTTISLKTWQSSSASRQDASSIIDSHEQGARSRFADTVKAETTDKSTQSKTEGWHVEAEVEASWGFGSAKVSGGGSGEYSSGREEFSKNVGESVSEHAAESSSKRELSVTSSSERTEESGTESMIERTIKNVNVRRVLNFVFRELNQEYSTKVHLKDIRIGFCNDLHNSWEEVPVSRLMPFLNKHLKPQMVDKTAKKILKAVGIVFDINDTPVLTLDKVEIASNGSSVQISDAVLGADGEFPVPEENTYYRFKPGPLGQSEQSNPVDGVLLKNKTITMRTDSVLVEALLGQAEALDEYAMEIQEATASGNSLSNERERLIQKTAEDISDPVERSEAIAKMTGTCCMKDSE